MEKKNVFGLSDNIAGALCYSLFYFTGLFFLVMEKDNKIVRFHALQSTLWFVLLSVISFLLNIFVGWIFLLGGIIMSLLSLVTVVSWVYLMYMAYKGVMFRLPVIGDVVWNQINK